MKNINRKNNISPSLFTKKINTNYELVSFNVSVNDVGRTKYLPPVAKEWRNSVYNYYSNNTINYPVYDLKVNYLIKGYFNMYFYHRFIENKYISHKRKRKSFNKIFISKAEIKHTNSKAIVTIFVYNREKLILLKRIRKLTKKILVKVMMKSKILGLLSFPSPYPGVGTEIGRDFMNNTKVGLDLFNSSLRGDLNKSYKKLYYLSIEISNILAIIRKDRLRLSLNKYKFEDKFLYKLTQYISKYYGKKVEFNIVNVKSIAYNGDIFTEILTSKIEKEQIGPIWMMNDLLSKVVLPKVNRIIERGRIEKNVDLELVDNKYKNLNISSIINNNNLLKDGLNKLLYNIYNKTTLYKENHENLNIRDIILDNIKYKNMMGAKLIVKGRLTKRYRADRAVYKIKWKGGLKDIDSAFKGLSTVQYRGYLDSNVQKSSSVSKRRIGSFGVRTWIAGKSYSTLARRDNFSTIHPNAISNIQPWVITGFCDAEGSFMVNISSSKKLKTGWDVLLRFQVTLHRKDRAIL